LAGKRQENGVLLTIIKEYLKPHKKATRF